MRMQELIGRLKPLLKRDVSFNEDGMESKQDDTNIAKEYNLNPFDIITGEGTSSWL